MSLFKTDKEKTSWKYVVAIMILIAASLFLGNPVLQIMKDNNVQASFFLSSMVLIGLAIFYRNSELIFVKTKLYLFFSFAAVILLLLVRLGIEERSHLIEYGIITLLVYKAVEARFPDQKEIGKLKYLAALIFAIGLSVIDEILQHFFPNRVFDLQDLLFNTLAVLFTLGVIFVTEYMWLRQAEKK